MAAFDPKFGGSPGAAFCRPAPTRRPRPTKRAPTEADDLIEETLISPFIALLHLFHGLLGVVLRIEGADQVHLVSGLVAEHLASLAVVADIKLLGESGRSERRNQNCCNQILSHRLSLDFSWPLTKPGREQSSGALLRRRNGLEAAYAGGGVANVTAPLGAPSYHPPSQP